MATITIQLPVEADDWPTDLINLSASLVKQATKGMWRLKNHIPIPEQGKIIFSEVTEDKLFPMEKNIMVAIEDFKKGYGFSKNYHISVL